MASFAPGPGRTPIGPVIRRPAIQRPGVAPAPTPSAGVVRNPYRTGGMTPNLLAQIARRRLGG